MSKPTNTRHIRKVLYKSTTTSSLPTRDELLGFLLDPSTTQVDLHTVSKLLAAAAAVLALPNYQAMQREHNAEKHCARCHASFTDNTNGSTACVIPHVFTTSGSYRVGPYTECYPSKCCGNSVELEEDGPGNCDYINLDRLGVCYEGYHTEDVEEVKGDREGRYNCVNIWQCKIVDKECVREVLDADDEPILHD